MPLTTLRVPSLTKTLFVTVTDTGFRPMVTVAVPSTIVTPSPEKVGAAQRMPSPSAGWTSVRRTWVPAGRFSPNWVIDPSRLMVSSLDFSPSESVHVALTTNSPGTFGLSASGPLTSLRMSNVPTVRSAVFVKTTLADSAVPSPTVMVAGSNFAAPHVIASVLASGLSVKVTVSPTGRSPMVMVWSFVSEYSRKLPSDRRAWTVKRKSAGTSPAAVPSTFLVRLISPRTALLTSLTSTLERGVMVTSA